MVEGAEGLQGDVEYNVDLFDEATISRMVRHLEVLLGGVVANPDERISHLGLLTEAEREQLLEEWNETTVEFPDGMCIHEMIEAQVDRTPKAIAATFEGERLTYGELNRRANQLGHYLQKEGVGPEVLVGICVERSLEMVVGILGVLKAGGAYVPLDPTYPKERIAFMLEDSQVSVLLTQERLEGELPRHGGKVIRLDGDWEVIAQESEGNVISGAKAENLAYVIYTSGSTGKPKGAMLQHRGLCNLANAQRRAFGVGEGSRVLQFSPFSFDASVWETVMALCWGGTLCLARREVMASGSELLGLLREEGITTVTLPPSVLSVISGEGLPELRTVIAAGEACTKEIVRRWGAGRRFFNAYGPTEATVCASMALCREEDEGEPVIGRPIDNTQLYVLDRQMELVPVGVPGELHIGGVSLARGYLNRGELTAEKFVVNPYSRERGGRLYKTGDLVRYLRDGNIEFLGRIDEQVKVRGFRIELGEIEAVMREHPRIKEGVVVAREDVVGDKRLVGYVVVEGEVDIRELKGYMRERLPEYMVPGVIVEMEGLPVSPSGKVDRKALPVPDGEKLGVGREYVGPRTETEARLVEICMELLGLERVGINDNFFDLGGHSLLATQFISRLRDAFHIDLPLRALFESPTAAELAEKVELLMGDGQTHMDKIAEMLNAVEQLTEEEVKALMAERKLGN